MKMKKISAHSRKRRIFLDYAAATPLDSGVFSKMRPFMTRHTANPSSLYSEALVTKRALEDARRTVSSILSATPDEIIFMGGGTESNNAAILGVARRAFHNKLRPHIISTAIEHVSVLEACRQAEREGAELTVLSPDRSGVVQPEKIIGALKADTVLVSVMYANNELGVIEPIHDIGRALNQVKRKRNSDSSSDHGVFPYFHTDASQAAQYLPLNIHSLGVNLLTLDSSKFYGPRGAGALFVEKSVPLEPLIVGGKHERSYRAGTENISAIVGLAEALRLAHEVKENESARLTTLRDNFIAEVLMRIPDASLNGQGAPRLPSITNICVPDLDSEFAVISLDEEGIAISSVSACKHLSDDSSSYVLEALGTHGLECARSSLRFSLGRETTKKDLDMAIKILVDVVSRIRA